MPDDISTIEPAAGLGHNLPPLAEQLIEETAPFRERATALISSVQASRITDPETAAQVTTLGGMLRDLRVKVEAARKERVAPFDDGKAAVQRAYAREIIAPLDEAMEVLREMLDGWRAKLAAEAAAETRRREAEAAAHQRAAEEAERKKEAAQAAGDAGAAIKAEIEEVQARDRAEALTQAEGIRPEAMIRTQTGAAVTATTKIPVVVNLRLAMTWLIKNQSPALLEAITPIITRLLRAKVEIPGVKVREQTTTRFTR